MTPNVQHSLYEKLWNHDAAGALFQRRASSLPQLGVTTLGLGVPGRFSLVQSDGFEGHTA
jgi:hypothetical protein